MNIYKRAYLGNKVLDREFRNITGCLQKFDPNLKLSTNNYDKQQKKDNLPFNSVASSKSGDKRALTGKENPASGANEIACPI